MNLANDWFGKSKFAFKGSQIYSDIINNTVDQCNDRHALRKKYEQIIKIKCEHAANFLYMQADCLTVLVKQSKSRYISFYWQEADAISKINQFIMELKQSISFALSHMSVQNEIILVNPEISCVNNTQFNFKNIPNPNNYIIDYPSHYTRSEIRDYLNIKQNYYNLEKYAEKSIFVDENGNRQTKFTVFPKEMKFNIHAHITGNREFIKNLLKNVNYLYFQPNPKQYAENDYNAPRLGLYLNKLNITCQKQRASFNRVKASFYPKLSRYHVDILSALNPFVIDVAEWHKKEYSIKAEFPVFVWKTDKIQQKWCPFFVNLEMFREKLIKTLEFPNDFLSLGDESDYIYAFVAPQNTFNNNKYG